MAAVGGRDGTTIIDEDGVRLQPLIRQNNIKVMSMNLLHLILQMKANILSPFLKNTRDLW
jgi:hypothetical protein